jgi:hypothetical protein
MEYAVEARSANHKKWIEALLPSMIRQLGLERSRKTLLVSVEKHDNLGGTVPLDPIDAYVVTISPGKLKDIGLTLAHEMVHVRQLARGILKIEDGKNYWKGKRYTKKTKYLDQPWEQDAFARQELIFRRAIEE